MLSAYGDKISTARSAERLQLTLHFFKRLFRPVAVPGEREAARIAEDSSQYIPMGAGTFLPRERQFVRAAMSHEGEWQRLATMSRLRFQEIKVLCVSADMLLWRMTPPELYDEMTVTLNVGDVIEPK